MASRSSIVAHPAVQEVLATALELHLGRGSLPVARGPNTPHVAPLVFKAAPELPEDVPALVRVLVLVRVPVLAVRVPGLAVLHRR